MKKVIVVGAGPSGLFCAFQLLEMCQQNIHSEKVEVHLFDQMSSAGRKFLVAGKSGLNLTHAACIEDFASKYGKDELLFKKLIQNYSPGDVRSWADSLGVATFVGTSGRVFPTEMKAAKMLSQWLGKLKTFSNFHMHFQHRFVGFDFASGPGNKLSCSFKHSGNRSEEDDSKLLNFTADAIVLALGGGSWSKTGSDGKWMSLFNERKIHTVPFKAANCGFEIDWSDSLIKKLDRSPLKNIQLSIGDCISKGEMMITPFGIEGTAVYNLSYNINEKLHRDGKATLTLDLKPGFSQQQIVEKLKTKRKKDSVTNYLRKSLRFTPAMTVLARELNDEENWKNPEKLNVKSLQLNIKRARPVEEAISTSGGVDFDELNSKLELKQYPGVYVIGEMLDFHAPTGGFLLQACFSTAFYVAQQITALAPDIHHR